MSFVRPSNRRVAPLPTAATVSLQIISLQSIEDELCRRGTAIGRTDCVAIAGIAVGAARDIQRTDAMP